jgi:urease accessory protein
MDLPASPSLPRARGAARLTVRRQDVVTRIHEFRHEGSTKLLFPGGAGPGLTAVVLNTAGGWTGGDRFSLTAGVGSDADLTLTTQAAERGYRALPGASPARVTTDLSVGPGARLDWLPQETILYHGAALDRHLTVDLAPDARALLVEPLVLGRLAMGETVRALRLTDRWLVRRDGRPILADALRIDGDAAALVDRAAIGGGARALALVALAAPGAAMHLPKVRALLPDQGGASAPEPDLLVIRLLAPDSLALRGALIPVIEYLAGRGLPKVWRL